MLSSVNKIRRPAALFAAAVIILAFVLSAAACAKKNDFKVPDGMTREEAALFTAVAKVCPKDDNHSKMDDLTFRIEGWSFDTIPQPILDYLQEYCFAGGASMMQFSDEQLRQLLEHAVAHGYARFARRQDVLDERDAAHGGQGAAAQRFVLRREGGGCGMEREQRGGNRRYDAPEAPAREPVRSPYPRPFSHMAHIVPNPACAIKHKI